VIATQDDMRSLARDAVRALPLYAPDAAECAIDLSDSTNLWGPPPAAWRAITSASRTRIARYPSLRSEPLTAALLRYAGLGASDGVRAVTGCGSDDVIDSTMRAFGVPGDRVAFSAPTFSMVSVFARLNGLEPVSVPLTDRFDLDVERLVDTDAKIIYICAPNNPTATAVSREAVEFVAAHAGGIVLLDEAYAEFAPESFIELVGRYDRLLVTRTFSKAFGLAGLRVGYGVGSAALVSVIERARGPYKVNALAEGAVLASLEESDDGLRWVRAKARLAVEIRNRLVPALSALDLVPLPSAANFVFVPTANALSIARGLRERGILVRAFTDLPRALPCLAVSRGAALRIGVGPWEVMETLLDALAEALRCE
jgi:histidinol-phosphate aminotransferase